MRDKIKACETKSITVFRSRCINPKAHPFTLSGIVLKEYYEFDLLGAAFDSKMILAFSLQSNFSNLLCVEEVLASVYLSRLLQDKLFQVLSFLFWSTCLWCVPGC